MVMKILITLLFIPMTAFAADWVLISASQDLEIEVDIQSVKPNKGAWFKYINTPAESDNCAGKDKKKGYSKNYVEANCKENTIRVKQEIVYSEDGSVLEYCGYSNPKATFTEYAPETIGEVYFKAICHAWARDENKLATYLRDRRAARVRVVDAAKQRAAEGAASQERINRLKLEASKKTGAGNKPSGGQCKTSSECYGALVCEWANFSTMQCMSLDEAKK